MDETKMLSCDEQPKQVKAKMKEFVDPVLVEGNVRPSFEWQCVDRRGWRKEFARAYALARRRC